MQLRRRRPITPRAPRGHMQRRRHRRSRRRLPDADTVVAPSVNDRLVPRHVLDCPLGRRKHRLLDSLAVLLVGHRPQHRHRLRHRQRHLDVRDPGHPLDHRTAPVVEKHLATLVARLALERPRAAQLLAGPDVLPLQYGDQIVPLDRLAAPHAELPPPEPSRNAHHRRARATAGPPGSRAWRVSCMPGFFDRAGSPSGSR